MMLRFDENSSVIMLYPYSLSMSSKRTHRSRAQKRDDAHIACKRARGDYIAAHEHPNLDDIPLGTDNGSHYHENNAR